MGGGGFGLCSGISEELCVLAAELGRKLLFNAATFGGAGAADEGGNGGAPPGALGAAPLGAGGGGGAGALGADDFLELVSGSES